MIKEMSINVGKLNIQKENGSVYVNNNHIMCNEDDSITLHHGVFKFGNKTVVVSQGEAIITIDEKGFTINP